jgi:putative addiction module killer protein
MFMNIKQIKIYETPKGKKPFVEWIESIKDIKTKRRLDTRLDRLEFGNFGDRKSVGDGVFELRLDFGAGYRVYYGEIGNIIVLLLLGGDKSTQERDIVKARACFKDYMEHLNNEKTE